MEISSTMKKRETCYVCNPVFLELFCPNDNNHRITWSEYENHIWCYDCEKDIEYEPGYAGPILIETAKLLGIDYRKYDIKTGKIIESNEC